MHELANELLSRLKASWRYPWYAVVFAWIVAVGGWVVVYLIPDRYEATARVYVDTQTVLRPLLTGLAVQPNFDQLVAMMSRTLITRPNVEKVMRMADMDILLKTPEDREYMVDRLIRDLTIKSAGRDNVYTISFIDKNPQDAKRVVQSLLTIFVEGSLGDKRKDSDSAQRFIGDQLKAYGEKLTASEDAVTEFKRKNMALMGNEAKNYYIRLSEAKNALSQAALELKEAENGRDAIKRQLTGGEDTPNLLGEPDTTEERKDVSISEIDGRIQALQQKLDALRLNYTEQHPDIISITRIMNQLREQKQAEAKLREQKQAEAKLKNPPPASAPTRSQIQNPIFQQLSVSFAEAEASVAARKARVAEFTKRFEDLKAAANQVPQVEAEYTQLTRGYEVVKRNFETLMARRESAQMGQDMEANATVIDFRVIDPPQVPSVPSAPKRPLLISLVLLAALAAGAGFAFLMNEVRPTFNDERRLREVSGLPVLGTVVMAWTDEQKSSQRKRLVAFLLSFLSLLSAYAAIMVTLVFTASRA